MLCAFNMGLAGCLSRLSYSDGTRSRLPSGRASGASEKSRNPRANRFLGPFRERVPQSREILAPDRIYRGFGDRLLTSRIRGRFVVDLSRRIYHPHLPPEASSSDRGGDCDQTSHGFSKVASFWRNCECQCCRVGIIRSCRWILSVWLRVRARVCSERLIGESFGNPREGTRRGDSIQRWTRGGAGRDGIVVVVVVNVVSDDTDNGRSETRWCGTKASELVVLRPTELVVGDEAVLVLVLVLEDLLDELIVVGQHLFHILVLARAGLLSFQHLFPQVVAHLQTTTTYRPRTN